MYKLLIVDDEPLIREGLRDSICWSDCGFVIVGEATNGRDALLKIEELGPDVVLTDMRMGIMDGTNLIPTIKHRYPSIQIVILTAYNEFTYAKLAIEHHVFAYISKPALNEEITHTFRRLKTKMDQDRQVLKELHSYYDYRMDALLTQLLYDSHPADADIDKLRKGLHIQNTKSDFFLALLEIDTTREAEAPSATRRLSLMLNERLDYYLSINENSILKATLSPSEIALLVFTASRDFRQQTAFLHDISNDFGNLTQVPVTIGVSGTFRSLAAIHRSYEQARKALSKKAQLGPGTIIDYMKVSALHEETPVLSEQEIQSLIQSVILADKAAVTDALHRYFDSLETRNINLTDLKSNMTTLATATIRQVFKSAYTVQLVFGKSIRPAADIDTLQTVMDIQAYMQDFLDRILLSMQCTKSLQIGIKQYSPLINKAVSYIIMNYPKNIKVSDVAEKLYISESRLMHIFKEETGKTFNSFLTEYRIGLAEAMIKSGHYKLYEISELVGYQNPITFRKAFTKIIGSIPSKYQ